MKADKKGLHLDASCSDSELVILNDDAHSDYSSTIENNSQRLTVGDMAHDCHQPVNDH